MSFSTFTDQQVFDDASVNVLCNRIYENLIQKFGSGTFQDDFCITGTVARIIQGATLEDIKVIAFRTNDSDYFAHLANSLPKAIGATARAFKDRIQMNYKGIYLEFWYAKPIGTINIVTDLAVEDPADIPLNIL